MLRLPRSIRRRNLLLPHFGVRRRMPRDGDDMATSTTDVAGFVPLLASSSLNPQVPSDASRTLCRPPRGTVDAFP